MIGPILFLVYINDLPAKLQSKVRLFADDTIVYMAVTNETDAAVLQKDLKLLEEWENRSQMSFHPDKCNVKENSDGKYAVFRNGQVSSGIYPISRFLF